MPENPNETPQDAMVQIPSQGWYNLVVYDADPKTLRLSLEITGAEDEEAILETIERGLMFIQDRYNEETYSDKEDNLPTREELHRNEQVLIDAKRNILSEGEEEAILFDDE